MKKNIFLALDFNSLDKALDVTSQTKEYLAGIKIGLELFNTIGLEGIKEFEKFKLPIFLDTKIFDIPNQVVKTIKVISGLKAIKYFTIHSLGSLEMLKAAKKAAEGSELEFLAVSLLTSWDESDLKKILRKTGVQAAAIGSMAVYQKKGMGVLIRFPKRSQIIRDEQTF